MSLENDISQIKRMLEAENIFKPASQEDMVNRRSATERATAERRAKDTWKDRILDVQPGVDPVCAMYFEDWSEDAEDRDDAYRYFAGSLPKEYGIDLMPLMNRFLFCRDVEQRDEPEFDRRAARVIARAGLYVYYSNNYFEVFTPEEMKYVPYERDDVPLIGEAVTTLEEFMWKEAKPILEAATKYLTEDDENIFKPASPEEIAKREADAEENRLWTLDDVRPISHEPSGCLVVDVDEDGMGNMTITFEDGRSLFAQIDTDIDSFCRSMAIYNGRYYISDEYYDLAESRQDDATGLEAS